MTATYPDMQGITAPRSNPSAPVAWDTFSPPVDASTPAGNAPIFGEWTRTGGADDTLVVTGFDFSQYTGADRGKDTLFRFYGQTTGGNGVECEGNIQRLKNNDRAAITLPTALPSWSMYLLWPRSDNGYGYPVAVNRTEAWWIGPNKAASGETVSIFGRNLSNNNGTDESGSTSWVYIEPADSGSGSWISGASITDVNPYKVSFTVPQLAVGEYHVYIHNGHGGAYGWSDKVTLHVWTAPYWEPSYVVNVSPGAGDDTARIQAAINAADAAGDYSTISFASGIYEVDNDMLYVRDKMRWQGASNGITKLSSSSNRIMVYGDNCGGGAAYLCFENITFENTYVPPVKPDPTPVLYLRNCDYLWLSNVKIESRQQGVFLAGSEHVILRDCNFAAGLYALIPGSRQNFIDSCSFSGLGSTPTLISINGNTEELSVTNSTGQDVNSGAASGCGLGRWLTACGSKAAASCSGTADFRNVYIGNNTTTDMGPFAGSGDAEQIQWERFDNYFRDYATDTSTSGTVNFASCASGANYVGKTAIIVGGKGIGQRRDITAFNSGTFTVSPAWSIIPNSTSFVMVSDVAEHIAVYKNTLDGKANGVSNEFNASQGIEPYASSFDIVADGNHGSDLRRGIISSWSLARLSNKDDPQSPLLFAPCYFNLYVNNSSENCHTAISTFGACYSGGNYNGTNNLGNIYRNNTLSNSVDTAWRIDNAMPYGLSAYSGPTDWFDMTVFEHNTISNAPYGVKFEQTAPDMTFHSLLYNNSFSVASGGLYGIDVPYSGQSPAYRQNSWTGFETTYAGANQPGAVLEVPHRFFNFTGTVGGSPDYANLKLWNSGSATLNWTATIEGSPHWLTLTSYTGTLASENSYADVCIIVDPYNLAAGTYNATIALTCNGVVTRKALVTFTVSAFTPKTYSGLKFWLKADAGVTMDGSNHVTQWADQSNNGYVFTSAGPGSSTWSGNLQGGQPGIIFNQGASTFSYMSTDFTACAMSGHSVFFVLKPTTLANWDQRFSAGSGWGYFSFQAGNNGVAYCGTDVDTRFTTSDLSGGTLTLNSCKYHSYVFDNGAALFNSNGLLRKSKTGMATPANWPGFTLGSSTSWENLCGNLHEVIVYSTALSPGNRQQVEKYLGDKYHILPPVTGLVATAAGSGQIDLQWLDGYGETDYKVERSTTADDSGFSYLASTSAGVTTFSDTSGLAQATTYYYRVRAYYSNTATYGPYSQVVSATTSLDAPTGLTATTTSISGVTLNWNESIPNESGFKIERKEWATGSWSQIGTAAADATSYGDSNLTAGKTYFYRVRAYRGAVDSAYTAEANASTIPTGKTLWLMAGAGISMDGSSLVSGWTSQEGSGTNMMSASGSDRPTWLSSGQNGQPVIHFTSNMSSKNIMTLTGKDWNMKNCTLFFVIKPSSINYNNQTIAASGRWDNQFFFSSSSSGSVYVGTNVNTRLSPAEIPSNTIVAGSWHRFTWKLVDKVGTKGDAYFYKNGGTPYTKESDDPVNWGGFTLGDTATTYSSLDCDLAEVILYNSALSDTDRQAVENYLRDKYDIP